MLRPCASVWNSKVLGGEIHTGSVSEGSVLCVCNSGGTKRRESLLFSPSRLQTTEDVTATSDWFDTFTATNTMTEKQRCQKKTKTNLKLYWSSSNTLI